jgi:hypothetical protein
MTDPVFLDLMRHYVDFERMQKGTVSSSSYGHNTTSRDTVAETFSDVRTRVRTLSSEEVESNQREGEVTSDFICYVPYDYIPVDLKIPKNATIYRVVNIRTIDLEVVDSGPFDIQNIKLMAGEQHHFQLRLLKVN